MSLHEGAAGCRAAPEFPCVIQDGFEQAAGRASFGPVAVGPLHHSRGGRGRAANKNFYPRVIVELVKKFALYDLVGFEVRVADPALFAEAHIESVLCNNREKRGESGLEVMQMPPCKNDFPGLVFGHWLSIRHAGVF